MNSHQALDRAQADFDKAVDEYKRLQALVNEACKELFRTFDLLQEAKAEAAKERETCS